MISIAIVDKTNHGPVRDRMRRGVADRDWGAREGDDKILFKNRRYRARDVQPNPTETNARDLLIGKKNHFEPGSANEYGKQKHKIDKVCLYRRERINVCGRERFASKFRGEGDAHKSNPYASLS